MIGSILISLIVFNQLKLVQRFPLNSLRPVASLKGSCWGLYYSSCTSTIYVRRSSDKLSFYLFADDTNLLYADRDIYSLERVVIAELRKVQEWLVANKLTLNAKKSNFVIFHSYQKKLDRDVILKMFDIHTNEFVLLDQNISVSLYPPRLVFAICG